MYYKRLCFYTIILLVICTHISGKKIKKNKRPKENVESTTIEPNVVAYSTFGFNDVGSNAGFVPTSPEYSSFLSGGNRETATRLYAPAFPSAPDTTGFSGNYGSQSIEGQPFGVNKDEVNQPGMSQYASNSINFISSPNLVNEEQSKNTDYQSMNKQNLNDSDAPVYGTKINSRHKNKHEYLNSNIDFATHNDAYSNPPETHYFNAQENEQPQEKPAFSEFNSSNQNTISYIPNLATQETDSFGKTKSSNGHNVLNFPRVVDFTNLSNKYYPTELDTSKLKPDSMFHTSPQSSLTNTQIDNLSNKQLPNTYSKNKFTENSPTRTEQHHNFKNNEENNKQSVKLNTYMNPDFTHNHIVSQYKHSEASMKTPDQKKKIMLKPWASGNHSNAIIGWKDTSSSSSSSSLKGYGYSTNYSNMNFRYDTSEPKKPFNPDEIIPASSNVVDLASYQFTETDYNKFKKMPKFRDYDEKNEESPNRDLFKSGDYLNQFKNTYDEVQTTTNSYWGNTFKATDYSSFRDHYKKPYAATEITHDDIVNIPKRPYKLSYSKGSPNKQVDLPSHHYRPQKTYKPIHDWTKDFIDTRYKSEEDLLGLRTHDTSHPSYLPTYKPSLNVENDEEFKQLVEKWKQSYIKAKYRDMPARDYEGYDSEIKPQHVPILKPYPIEVPHPVLVPVPRPFPVRVPISRPVAVPILQELTVPIEKPVPYPVYKNVPYPVEKLVPVPVEKEVPVPVEKPYPVHIPHIRPVFHHTKPVYEDPEHLEEEDYIHRPEYKKLSNYKKRTVYGTHNKSRRPSRASYQDRNRRRWPDRRRPSGYNSEYKYRSRPSKIQHSSRFKHTSYEREMDEDEYEYRKYCRSTGNC